MFDNGLSRGTLRSMAKEAVKEFIAWDDKHKADLWDWLGLVFQKWKIEHGDRNPLNGQGLLSTGTKPFDDAEPWECAGIGVGNYIDLAFKLWADNYPEFMRVVEKVSLRKVFAMVILQASEATRTESVVRANNLLNSLKEAELEFALEYARPLVKTAIEFKCNQKKKAGKPRGRVGEDGETIAEIIATLAMRKDELGDELPAKELWGEFFSQLDSLDLNPKETEHQNDFRKNCISYDFKKDRKPITFGRFSNVISKFRS